MPNNLSKAGLLLVAMLFVGCGVDFSGVYTGNATDKFACQDGSDGTIAYDDFSVEIAPGDNGFILKTANCGEVELNESGSVLSPKSTTCPPTTNDGVKRTTTLKPSGTMELDGTALRLSLDSDIILERNGVAVTCTSKLTGTLAKSK